MRGVAGRLGIPRKKADLLIDFETRGYFRYVERIADAYNDLDWQRYAVVVGDANYAPALTKFISADLGWLPALMVVTTAVNEEDEHKINGAVESLASKYPVKIVYETDPTEIKNHFRKHAPLKNDALHQDVLSPVFVIGSHLEREFAADIGAEHLTVSSPVGNRVVMNRGYAGFDGSLSLIEDLLSVIAAQR